MSSQKARSHHLPSAARDIVHNVFASGSCSTKTCIRSYVRVYMCARMKDPPKIASCYRRTADAFKRSTAVCSSFSR